MYSVMDGVRLTYPPPSHLPPCPSYGTLEGSVHVLRYDHVEGETVLMLRTAGFCGREGSPTPDPVLIKHVLLSHGSVDGGDANVPPLSSSQHD